MIATVSKKKKTDLEFYRGRTNLQNVLTQDLIHKTNSSPGNIAFFYNHSLVCKLFLNKNEFIIQPMVTIGYLPNMKIDVVVLPRNQ